LLGIRIGIGIGIGVELVDCCRRLNLGIYYRGLKVFLLFFQLPLPDFSWFIFCFWLFFVFFVFFWFILQSERGEAILQVL